MRMVKGNPNAYTRITRTPIYHEQLQDGAEGQYKESRILPGHIVMPPGNMDPNTLRHESAHAIYDKAGLEGMAGRLAGQVSPRLREQFSNQPMYNANDPYTVSNEGLGWSVGDPRERGYVNHVASQISDPLQRQRLLRLQAMGIGGIQGK